MFNDSQAVREVLFHITSRWGFPILLTLRHGTRRFNQLCHALDNVSERMLVRTLRGLEADGLIVRTIHTVGPPHVEYRLTAMGEEAAAQVSQLTGWIESRLPEITAARWRTGEPSTPLACRERQGLK